MGIGSLSRMSLDKRRLAAKLFCLAGENRKQCKKFDGFCGFAEVLFARANPVSGSKKVMYDSPEHPFCLHLNRFGFSFNFQTMHSIA